MEFDLNEKKICVYWFYLSFVLLVACSRHRPNPSTFEFVPHFRVNPKLDGLVTMEIEIEAGALIETIENRSEFPYWLRSSFP